MSGGNNASALVVCLFLLALPAASIANAIEAPEVSKSLVVANLDVQSDQLSTMRQRLSDALRQRLIVRGHYTLLDPGALGKEISNYEDFVGIKEVRSFAEEHGAEVLVWGEVEKAEEGYLYTLHLVDLKQGGEPKEVAFPAKGTLGQLLTVQIDLAVQELLGENP